MSDSVPRVNLMVMASSDPVTNNGWFMMGPDQLKPFMFQRREDPLCSRIPRKLKKKLARWGIDWRSFMKLKRFRVWVP